MQSFWLPFIAVPAYIAGVAIVYALTGNIRHIRRYQALAIVAGLAALLIAFTALAGWLRVPGIVFIPLFLIVGYLSRTRAFLRAEDTRDLPPLTRTPNTPGLGFTAVVHLTHGEPEQYDPTGLINAFREADAAGMPIGPVWARPFSIAQLRKQYMTGARSEHRSIHRRMLKALEQAEQGPGEPPKRYYLAFLDDEPRPEAAVIQALNDGADGVVVLEVYTVDTPHSAAGRTRMAETVAALEGAPPLYFTGPLADVPALQQLYAARAAAQTPESARPQTGVLLVALGRTATWIELFPQSAAAEKRYLAGAVAALEQAGFPLVRQARLHGDPAPINMAEELADAGAQTILYALATESADSQLSQRVLPDAIARAIRPNDCTLVNMGAWNDDPLLIEALQLALHGALDPAANTV